MKKTTKQSLPDDGERMVPEYHKGIITYGEHMGRYEAVLPAIKGLVVLDIACGSGYGSKLMAAYATKVYGVDIDPPAIKYASENYGGKNIQYLKGDGIKIPLPDNSVDCVISMETIEHIKDQVKFLDEAKRVMKSGGFMIISTPNTNVYPEGNKFHLKELDQKSFVNLMRTKFKKVELHHQLVSIASSILDENDLRRDELQANWPLYKTYKSKPSESIYFLGVCSDGALPRLQKNSFLSQEYSHLEQKKIADYVGQLNKTIIQNNQNIADLRQNLEHELNQNKLLHSELSAIYKTKAWRIVSAARKVKGAIRKKGGN